MSEIKNKDVETLFGKQPKDMVEQLMPEISGLEKHMSICNKGYGKPLLIEDRAFGQLIALGKKVRWKYRKYIPCYMEN